MNLAPFPMNPVLTGIAIAYKNAAYIADECLPRVPVGLQTYKWKKYDIGETFKVADTHVGRTGKPGEIEFTWTESSDSTVDQGLEDPIPLTDIEQGALVGYDPVNFATERLTDKIMLAREKRTAAIIFGSSNYGSQTTTLSGTSQWSDQSNSDPLGVILDTKASMLVEPNVLVLGPTVYRYLQTHPKVVGALYNRDTGYGRANKQFLADLFEVEQVLVAGAWNDTAKEGQTTVKARIWGKHAALLHINKLARAGDEPTFGFTAEWGGKVAASWEDKNIGLRGGTRVRVGESVKETICAADLGWMIINAVA